MQKGILFLIVGFSILNIYAQESKEQRKHREKKEKSAHKQSAEVSLDTLFYKGVANCIYKVVEKTIFGPSEISVFSIKNNVECLKISMQSVGSGSTATYFWKWIVTLPNNNTSFNSSFASMPYSLLAKHNVMNDSTINLVGLKNLVNMEALEKHATVVIVPSPGKPALTERNRNAMVMIIGENIMQDNVIIGKINQESIAVNGNVYMAYTIKNNKNSIIARATNESITSHHWQIVTSSNNLTEQLNSSIGKDANDIVKFLVDNLYL